MSDMKNGNEQKNRNVAAFAAVFLGILTAGMGAQVPAWQQDRGPGAAIQENAGPGEAPSPDTEGVNAAAEGAYLPVVWYNDEGIFFYRPDTGKSERITAFTGRSTDRMTELYGEKNPADYVSFTEDGKRAYFMKGITTDYFGTTQGDLFCADLDKAEAERKDVLIAEGVAAYNVLPDMELVWLDSDSHLYRGKAGEDGSVSRKALAAGVLEYRVSEDGRSLFFHTDRGSGFRVTLPDGERTRVAEGIYSLEYVSKDLSKIYYLSETQDLFYIRDLSSTEIVDVDITDLSVIEKTGHVYYLKNGLAGSTAAAASDTGESAAQGADSPIVNALEELLKDYMPADAGETAADAGGGAETGEGAQAGAAGDSASAEGDGDLLSPGAAEEAAEFSEETGQLGFFDGSTRTVVKSGVTHINRETEKDVRNDRLLFTLGAETGYQIWLAYGEKPVNTGLTVIDEGLTDICPDYMDDVLYFIREIPAADAAGEEASEEAAGGAAEDGTGKPESGTPEDGTGNAGEVSGNGTGDSGSAPDEGAESADGGQGMTGKGAVYRLPYTVSGAGKEEKLFDGAEIITAAQGGKVYTGVFSSDDGSAELSVNGKQVSGNVASFYWDYEGGSDRLQLYRNVFEEYYYKSGEFTELKEDGTLRGIVYNVRECHGFPDGTYTFLTDYDEELLQGNLVWWSGGDPVTITDNASGTKMSPDEE